MSETRIELGMRGDLEPFIELLEDAAVWLWDRGLPQWMPGSLRAAQPDFSRWVDDGHLIVARVGSELAGGCMLVPHPTPEWADRNEPALYVCKLVVARAHAGRGLARQILADCDARARAQRADRLRLDCWDGNIKLRAFYRACGYRELDAVPFEDYWVRLFERDLTQP